MIGKDRQNAHDVLPIGLHNVIDAQVYFLSYNFFRVISQVPGHRGDIDEFMHHQARMLNIELPSRDPLRLADRWATEMDRYELSRLCLLAGVPGDEHAVANASRCFAERFVGLVTANPNLPIAEEIVEHAVRAGGIRGILLQPCRNRFHASDRRAYPIYILAKRHHLVVYLDYGNPGSTILSRWCVSTPGDVKFNDLSQLHFAAADFPTVPFVISTFCTEQWRELLRLGFLCPNISVTTASLTMDRTEGTLSSADLKSALASLLRAFGPHRLLFGSGSGVFPPGWQAQTFLAVRSLFGELGLATEQINLILAGNTARLFALQETDNP